MQVIDLLSISQRRRRKKKLPARKASINEYEEGLSIVRYLTE
jgi:hypothetical protein